MQIEINCQKRWFEARQKAEELEDHSLDECITRVISLAMSKDYEIERAEKEYNRAFKEWQKCIDLYNHFKDTPLEERAIKLKWKKYDIQQQKHYRFIDIKNGLRKLYISSDFSENSFYFYIENEDGSRYMNGGILYYNNSWHTHT